MRREGNRCRHEQKGAQVHSHCTDLQRCALLMPHQADPIRDKIRGFKGIFFFLFGLGIMYMKFM